MSVWIRRVAITLGVGVLVLAAGGVWLVTVFDPADHKDVAIGWMKARYDRTLGIAGPISLSVFPRLEIRVRDVSLSEAGGSDPFAYVDEAALAVELLPLLRHRLTVDRVEAHGVRLVLLRDAKGRRNVDDLLLPTPAPAAAPVPGEAASAKAQALQFDVSRILLSNVQARVKDELGGIDGELVLKDLSTGRIASQLESSLQMVAQFGFKSPALKGELSGSTRFTPDLTTGSLRLASMDLSYKGDAPGASSIDALLKGALAWDGSQSSLSARDLSLRITANTAGLRLLGTTLGIERFALDPARKSLAINQLQLRVKGSRSGEPLALDLDWPELDVSGEVLKGSALAGKLSYGGDVPLAVTFKSDAPGGSFDNVRVPAFEARLTSAASARKIIGGLRSELVLQPERHAALLDKLDVQLRLDEPGLKPLTLALKGTAMATAGNGRWNLGGDLNGNSFTTEGMATFAGITPNVRTAVRFPALDLNGLLEPATVTGAAAGGSSNAPFDLSALRSVNGSLDLRIGALALRQYRVTDATLKATLDAGMLRVSDFRGGVWGGTVAGSAFADARASRVALMAGAEGVSIQAVLKDMADKDLLEGVGRVDVDMESAGRTMAELKSRLKGKAALHLRDGAVKGVNLAKSLRTARAALNLKQDAILRPVKTEKTDFSELNATFQVDAGVARSTDLELKSPFLRLDGDGSIDIVKSRLDANLRTSVTDSPKGQDAVDMATLKGLTVPMQVGGPFDAINWKVQWSAAVASVLKAQAKGEVEKKLKEKLGARFDPKAPATVPSSSASGPSVEEKLKNKLKGLLP